MLADLTEILRTLAASPGQAFRDVVPVALVGTVVIMVLHWLLVLVTKPAPRIEGLRWSLWEKLLYAVALLGILDLGGTAFYSVLRHGAMEGWFLLAHMAGSGILILVLPLIAVTWCDANRLGLGGASTRSPGTTAQPTQAAGDAGRFWGLTKLAYWVFLASGLATALTMLLSMLPLFDTQGMNALLDLHRYSGLLLVVATLVHLYGVWLRRLGLR